MPSACTETVDPTTGRLIALTFSGPSPGNDTSRNITKIIENTALVGFTARPVDNLKITGDFYFGSNNYSFTRISPRQCAKLQGPHELQTATLDHPRRRTRHA